MLMLTEHGHEAHFITSIGFNDTVPEGVVVHAVLPHTSTHEIKKAAAKVIKKCKVTLTHDIVYLDSYRKHAEALSKIPAHYIHWIHSAPVEHAKREPIDGTYICMNYTDLPLLAEQFGIPESRCRVVYNPVSPDVYFGWHPFTCYLVKKYGLLDCDVLITYPLDTGRFTAKGGYKIIKLVEKLRDKEKNAKVVFVNAAANTKNRRAQVKGLSNDYTIFTSLEPTEENDYTIEYDEVKKELEQYNREAIKEAESKGLIWTTHTMPPPTSEYMPLKEYEVVVPRQVVRELFQISNVFPLLSISEGCSLTMLEAALAKNLVILNEDFPAMKEFGEIDHTLYMKVSSTRCTTRYNPNEESYYRDWANIIISKLESCHVNRFNRKVLKKFNREWIWQNQLEPLLK